MRLHGVVEAGLGDPPGGIRDPQRLGELAAGGALSGLCARLLHDVQPDAGFGLDGLVLERLGHLRRGRHGDAHGGFAGGG
ncbi:hypothetical protein NPS74_21995, partial [Cutibacterium acnes subsp. acnes]|nr:hypothetical protein [Cutibacterium acnes subsp. acnes]